MNKKNIGFSAVLALMSVCATAQEKDSVKVSQLKEVVISDTKFSQNKEQSGKIITVISQEEIQKRAGQNVAQVLNSAVGVEINGNQSAAGKNLGYYIRGGKNQQVLILIDGIPVTDASGIGFEYDLRLLSVDQVESIEVMKGAASTLYGSGAATAVINITLKKAGKKTVQGNAYVNIGSNNTAFRSEIKGQEFNQGIAVNGNYQKLNFYAGMNSTEVSGMSQIASPDNAANYEDDRFSRQNYISRIGYKANKNLTLDFFGNFDKVYNKFDLTFDNTGSNDTEVNNATSEQIRFGFAPQYTYQKGKFVLNSGYSSISRQYNELNVFTDSVDYSEYKSHSVNVDGFNKYEFSDTFYLVLGTNFQFHDMLSSTPYSTISREKAKFNMIDPYVTGVYTSDFGLNINAGARVNLHSEYGNKAVYNFNPSYNFNTTFPLKIMTSFSTAFITPSLYQLYSEFGNSELTPEENTTFEVGFETQLFSERLSLNAVAFYREQDNSIGFLFDSTTFEAKYVNVSGMNKAKGIETEMRFIIASKLTLNANYAYTKVDNVLDRLIPKHKINAGLDFQPVNRTFINVNYQYTGIRNDIFYDAAIFDTQTVPLRAYQLVNATVRRELIKKQLTVFGAVTNMLNERFVENTGYSARGRNFKLGLQFQF